MIYLSGSIVAAVRDLPNAGYMLTPKRTFAPESSTITAYNQAEERRVTGLLHDRTVRSCPVPHSMPPAEKTCTKCGVTKPRSEFYVDLRTSSGLYSECKVCRRARNAESLAANRERLNREARARYHANHERRLERQRLWRERNAESLTKRHRAENMAWQKRNPEKKRAHQVVYAAIKSGKLTRPLICSRCGATGRIEAHHADYSKPLDVQWLCRLCHAAITVLRDSDAA